MECNNCDCKKHISDNIAGCFVVGAILLFVFGLACLDKFS